jgi:hypothetical protein
MAFLTRRENFVEKSSAKLGFLRQENFVEKSSAKLGFLLGVIAFLSSLIVTMTWLHCSVPLGLNVNVFFFPLILSFMIPATTSIVALAVLKNVLPRMSGI